MNASVSVAELQHAWGAIRRGEFRTAVAAGFPRAPGERLLLVLGVAGQAGATTVATALAETVGADRLLDCAPTVTSGLVGACERELPASASGWLRGRRGSLLVERSPLELPNPAGSCPVPPVAGGGVTIVDAGADALTLLGARGWLADMLRDPSVPVVVVARCSVPSMRRLEVALDQLAPPGRSVSVALVGPPPRRWPRRVVLPPAVERLRRDGRVVFIPIDAALAVDGLGIDPIPALILAAVRTLEGTIS